jgi:hypothetical protein
MKVLNLKCAAQHRFEGWFGSEADFVDQQNRGLVACPLCGDTQVQKMLSAPRLNLRGSRSETEGASNKDNGEVQATESPSMAPSPVAAPGADMEARLLKAMRAVLANSEDVGDRFADQARAMHHGETEQRSIRGQTTPDVAMELMEEGIAVVPLPSIPALKETLQ